MCADSLERREPAEGLQATTLARVQDRRVDRTVGTRALASLEQEVELDVVETRPRTSQLDLSQEHREREVVRVQERTGRPLEDVQEEVLEQDHQARAGVCDAGERRVVQQDKVEDVEEEAEGELVEVVEEMKLIENEEDRAAGLCEGEVLARDLLDFRHYRVRLLDLARHVGCLALKRLERLNDPGQGQHPSGAGQDVLVVVENVPVRLVQRREQRLLEEVETGAELALEAEEIRALPVGVGSLDSEDLVERLCLKTGACDLYTG